MKSRRDHRRATIARFGFGLAALCLCALSPSISASQVLEIDSDGGVIVHDRPEVTLATGVTAIGLPRNGRGAEAGSARGDRAALSEAAARTALSPDLLEAVAWRESGLQPRVVSPAGAVGEMQLMPATARDLGVDPYDARQNIAGGAAYLSGLLKRYDGDVIRALAAYDAGPRAVDRYGGVPPYKETQDYVAAILDRLSRRATAGPEGR